MRVVDLQRARGDEVAERRRLLGDGAAGVALCVLVDGRLVALCRGFAGPRRVQRMIVEGVARAARLRALETRGTWRSRVACAELLAAGDVPKLRADVEAALQGAVGPERSAWSRLAARLALDAGDLKRARALLAGARDPWLEARLHYAERRPRAALACLGEIVLKVARAREDFDVLRAACLHDLERVADARRVLTELLARAPDAPGAREALEHLDAPEHRHDAVGEDNLPRASSPSSDGGSFRAEERNR